MTFLDEAPVDSLDGVSLPIADEDGVDLPPNSCPECAAEGVTSSFKTVGGLGSHRRSKHGIEGKEENKRPNRDHAAEKREAKVSINLGGGKAPRGKAAKEAARLAQTAKGATSFANFAATGLVFINQAEDAGDVAKNAEAFGNAIGELAQYQPWLSTVFAPSGEMTGEVAAWLGVAFVTAAMIIPIGARHGWIPENYARAFGVAMSAPAMAQAAAEGRLDDSRPE